MIIEYTTKNRIELCEDMTDEQINKLLDCATGNTCDTWFKVKEDSEWYDNNDSVRICFDEFIDNE